MFNKLKTRKGRLEDKIMAELRKETPNINIILTAVDSYEKDNLDTIEKLKKDKLIDMARINGALKQTINAHGPIDKLLIGSASKRIYGSLINGQPNKPEPMKKNDPNYVNLAVTVIVTLIVLGLAYLKIRW